MERLVAPVTWSKAARDPAGSLTGYASTFGNVDLGGDRVAPGAFAPSLPDINTIGIPLLADHRPDVGSVLGTIYAAEEDAHGLLIRARFASTPDAQAVRTKLLEGHLRKLSIGYETLADHYEDDADGAKVRVLDAVKLWETSVVVFPMNPQATVTGTKRHLDVVDPVDLDLRLAEAEHHLALAVRRT